MVEKENTMLYGTSYKLSGRDKNLVQEFWEIVDTFKCTAQQMYFPEDKAGCAGSSQSFARNTAYDPDETDGHSYHTSIYEYGVSEICSIWKGFIVSYKEEL